MNSDVICMQCSLLFRLTVQEARARAAGAYVEGIGAVSFCEAGSKCIDLGTSAMLNITLVADMRVSHNHARTKTLHFFINKKKALLKPYKNFYDPITF